MISIQQGPNSFFLSSIRSSDVEEVSEAKTAPIHYTQASYSKVSAGRGAIYTVAGQPTAALLV